MTIVHGLNEKMMRLVNMTKSKWLKIGLNMTKTDEPYFFEHDRKVTMTNINLLNSTKNNRIWPKIENIIYITTRMNMNNWIRPKIENMCPRLKLTCLMSECHLSPVTCHQLSLKNTTKIDRGKTAPPETPPPAHLLCSNKTTSRQ